MFFINYCIICPYKQKLRRGMAPRRNDHPSIVVVNGKTAAHIAYTLADIIGLVIEI